jgi:hypothetical protein
MTALNTTDYTSWAFSKDQFDRLVLSRPGQLDVVGVNAVRCFPYSAPQGEVSLQGPDGHELATLPNLDVLAAEARQMLNSYLQNQEFVPVIRKIVKSSAAAPPCQWTVETDHGTTIVVVESDDDVRKLGAGRLLIADTHGVRYLAEVTSTLDRQTAGILSRFS